MKRVKRITFLCAFLAVFCISSVFAGPFGIEMGMSLAEVRQACGAAPELIQDNVYEITPPKTNDMFETYYVRIDPEYGVYWLKAIGKDIYTNGYGERLISTFENLVASIRRTYGKELYRNEDVKEGSIWGEPEDFMFALSQGDRELEAVWSEFDENIGIFILGDMLEDPEYKDRVVDYMATSDTTALKALAMEKALQYKELPSDISVIGVYAKAQTTSLGSVWLEYRFSNSDAVDAKADSVF